MILCYFFLYQVIQPSGVIFSPSVLQSVHVLFARKIRICVVLAKVFHNRLLITLAMPKTDYYKIVGNEFSNNSESKEGNVSFGLPICYTEKPLLDHCNFEMFLFKYFSLLYLYAE